MRQGKSDNYQDAEEKGLLKAGAVAQLLSKKFNEKIVARELEVFATEWHHAGIFKAGQALKGKRVYFFSAAGIEKITLEKILSNRAKAARPAPPDRSKVQGWFPQYFRTTDPVSKRPQNKVFIGIYTGPANRAPKGFKALSGEAFTRAEKRKGKELRPGEVPKF